MRPLKHDGDRNQKLQGLLADVATVLPPARILTSLFDRHSHASDASFYWLLPSAVLIVESDHEVAEICRAANQHSVAITFRAAGTSLSGQAVTDSVLVKLGTVGWRHFEYEEIARIVTASVGLTGGQINMRLAKFQRKIGPDPASLDAAMLGGIVANKASGMCCGIERNAYHSMRRARIILADGTLLDTGDPESIVAFRAEKAGTLSRILALSERIRASDQLTALIKEKYSIKNTVGYSLNSLLDYEDPVDMLIHLMAGSEGTLGFISQISLLTFADEHLKAAKLLCFSSVRKAVDAAAILRKGTVSAVELLDSRSLLLLRETGHLPSSFGEINDQTSILLVDVRASSPAELSERRDVVDEAMAAVDLVWQTEFSTNPAAYAAFWKTRKELYPLVGARRPRGTTVIIEDVAVRMEHLGDLVVALEGLFERFGYHDGVIFGHVLDGNVHFVFSQSFSTPEAIDRYRAFMDEVVSLVCDRFRGSLKAEHGVGRNMTPFVEKEWGLHAYSIMRELKGILDPKGVLNPGVIISDDASSHLKNLKEVPVVDPRFDICVECGFCEPVCPSRQYTITPRQRIVALRAQSRLAAHHVPRSEQRRFARDLAYQVIDTCAGDSLCALRCPVSIDTGEIVRSLRSARRGKVGRALAKVIRSNYSTALATGAAILNLARQVQVRISPPGRSNVLRIANEFSAHRIPAWIPDAPKAKAYRPSISVVNPTARGSVVLFSSCANRIFGTAENGGPQSLTECLTLLYQRAGYRVETLDNAAGACCGMTFDSKGFPESAQEASNDLWDRLFGLSHDANLPVICDASPCAHFIRKCQPGNPAVWDVAESLLTHVLPNIEIYRQRERALVIAPCSSQSMGIEKAMIEIARACARKVIEPGEFACCGFAGDKGLFFPELNESALRCLDDLDLNGCSVGYSSSITCELGFKKATGMEFRSIAFLLEWASRPLDSWNDDDRRASMIPPGQFASELE